MIFDHIIKVEVPLHNEAAKKDESLATPYKDIQNTITGKFEMLNTLIITTGLSQDMNENLQDYAYYLASILSMIYNKNLNLSDPRYIGDLNELARDGKISENLYEACIDLINYDTDCITSCPKEAREYLLTITNKALDKGK